ncbi:MAG: hypothetical protein JRN15_00075 [Nitrososphaerota archaeon]|nr:hypothetical protein [Nitrososphaerota archaeon]
MKATKFGDQDEELRHEVVESAQIEEEELKSEMKKRKKLTEEIEEREALEEQPPSIGYPNDTAIPGMKQA